VHLKSSETLMLDEENLNYLSELIDWAHIHKLDFHMTEIDYNFVVESGDFIIMIGSFSDSKDLKTT
jgi:hypothetical protein